MNSEGQPLNTSCHQIPSMPITSLTSITFITLVIYVFDKRRGRKKMFTEKYPNFYSVLVFSSVSRQSLDCPHCQDSFMSMWPVQSHRATHSEGSLGWLMAFLPPFELHNFWTRGSLFSFCIAPSKLCRPLLLRSLIWIFRNPYLHFFPSHWLKTFNQSPTGCHDLIHRIPYRNMPI